MASILKGRLAQSMLLTDALAGASDDDILARHIPGVPSNSLGSQFWCVVGARESYAKAIAASAWVGFSCSLGEAEAKQVAALRAALGRSQATVLDVVSNRDLGSEQAGLAFDLLEHEALHQGQLIRYFYANEIAFPPEFASRYALSQPVGASAKTG